MIAKIISGKSIAYQHFDVAHPHIHVVTTNIRRDGSRISLYNTGKNQSETARKEIEKEFGLVKTESKKRDQKEFIYPINVKKPSRGNRRPNEAYPMFSEWSQEHKSTLLYRN